MLTWLRRWIVAVVAEDIRRNGRISDALRLRAPGDLRRDFEAFRARPE